MERLTEICKGMRSPLKSNKRKAGDFLRNYANLEKLNLHNKEVVGAAIPIPNPAPDSELPHTEAAVPTVFFHRVLCELCERYNRMRNSGRN